MIRFQIPTTEEERTEVKAYAKSAGISLNNFFIVAYKFYRLMHGGNPKENERLKVILESFFNIPFGLPPRMFVAFLYMLAQKYPKASSKHFWTEAYYVNPADYTHEQICGLIRQLVERKK